MPFLLDTSAISELAKPLPNPGLRQWMHAHAQDESYLSAPSIGEIEIGVWLLAPGKRRSALEAWLEALITTYHDRILPFDLESARRWGRAFAQARLRGEARPTVDSQIAAIASSSGLAVVTRNVGHFASFEDVTVVNPWS